MPTTDLVVRRRELDGVRKQVGQDLCHAVGVDIDFAGRCRIEPHAHAKAVGKAAIGVDGLLDQRARVNASELEDGLAGLDLFDIENIVDEADQPLAVALRDADEP